MISLSGGGGGAVALKPIFGWNSDTGREASVTAEVGAPRVSRVFSSPAGGPLQYSSGWHTPAQNAEQVILSWKPTRANVDNGSLNAMAETWIAAQTKPVWTTVWHEVLPAIIAGTLSAADFDVIHAWWIARITAVNNPFVKGGVVEEGFDLDPSNPNGDSRTILAAAAARSSFLGVDVYINLHDLGAGRLATVWGWCTDWATHFGLPMIVAEYASNEAADASLKPANIAELGTKVTAANVKLVNYFDVTGSHAGPDPTYHIDSTPAAVTAWNLLPH